LHEEPDQKFDSEIIENDPVEQHNGILIRKDTGQDLVDENPQHNQVGQQDHEDHPHDDIEHNLFLPEAGAHGGIRVGVSVGAGVNLNHKFGTRLTWHLQKLYF